MQKIQIITFNFFIIYFIYKIIQKFLNPKIVKNSKHLIFMIYLILYNIQFYQRLPFKRKDLSYR